MDAVIFQDISCIETGCVIRDEADNFLQARCQGIAGVWQSRKAEAINLREALSRVKNLNYRKCIFEMDAKLLADACTGG